jgi:hypothetical protein
MNHTVLLVGSGTDAAFVGSPISLENLTLADEPAPPGYVASLGGYSNRFLWSMVKLSVIPPGSKTPANSTGTRELAPYGAADVSFRGVRFVANRVGAAVSLRYLRRVVVHGCEFVGGNLLVWGPTIDLRVTNNSARLSCGAQVRVRSQARARGGGQSQWPAACQRLSRALGCKEA